ncbi:hypothetical protein JMG10_13265 [Nostoc ellipsosporum NOK]|nr:hypothetical protein [Nostoc ellipsosporum NOK]
MLYQSSKGAVEIDTMPLPYAANALAKLQRTEPTRTAEIDALQAHVDKLAAEASNDDENPRAVIGGNNPPADEPAPQLTGRAAIEAHVGDLLSEAKNWADGEPISNHDQADAVGRLRGQLLQAVALVDDAAAKEKKPHNDAIGEIGVWQNGFTAKGLKKTPDGSLTKAVIAIGNLGAAWLRKLDEDKRAREKEAADKALAAAQEAAAAREEAKDTTDLAVIDAAEDKLAAAMDLIGAAKTVSKEKVQAGGDGFRAMSLRTVHKATIEDAPDAWARAYGHFKQDPEFMAEFKALIQRYADRACRNEATRVRGVPGFNFIAEKVV